MIITEKLYADGLNLSQILVFVDNEIGKETNGKKPTDIINNCRSKIKNELVLFNNYGVTFQDRELANKHIEPYQEIITKLENSLLEALYSYIKKGIFVAFGYNDINNPYPVMIPIHEWNFLKIDKKNEVAYYEEKKYKAIRFVQSESLKQQLDETIPLIDKKPEPKLKTEQIDNSCKLDVDRNKTSSKQLKKREDNLTKAIKDAMLKMDKKPSLEELWQYFQKDKDETGIIEDYTDTHITWKDTKGILHDTKKTSLANRLSRIKP